MPLRDGRVRGKAAGLGLPFCNTETMSPCLAEIPLAIALGAHAPAAHGPPGRHTSGELAVPDNMTNVPLLSLEAA